MPAYVISEVRIVDLDLASIYMELARASIERHGGRYLVRAADPQVVEGDWDEGRRVVIVEFPSSDALTAWYGSSDYAAALAIREKALDRRLLFVRGA